MAVSQSEVPRVRRPSTRWRRCTCASAASARWRSPTTTATCVRQARRRQRRHRRAAPAHPGAARRTSGATPTSCPLAGGPPAPSGRLASRTGLPAGCTPLIRADRLAAALGTARGVGQERRGQPHSFLQGPRRLGRRGARPRAGLPDDRLRLHRQPRQLRGRARGGAGDGVLRVHPRRPGGAEGARHRRLRDQPGGRQGQLRRRQPPLHRAVRRARLGVRQHQPAPLLRRGLKDAGVRDRRAARLRAARPLRACRSPRARCSQRSPRALPSGASWGCSGIPPTRCRA